MTRPVIYISGPISNGGQLPAYESKVLVKEATDVAFDLIRRGYAVICPHWSWLAEGLVNSQLSHGEWLDSDMALVPRCDAVLRLVGDSKGADMEVAIARRESVPVFFSVDALIHHFTLRAVRAAEPARLA